MNETILCIAKPTTKNKLTEKNMNRIFSSFGFKVLIIFVFSAQIFSLCVHKNKHS